MPETRYIESYKYPPGLPPEQKIPANAKITRTAYVVSDEELAEERKAQGMEYLLKEIDSLSKEIDALKLEIDELKTAKRVR